MKLTNTRKSGAGVEYRFEHSLNGTFVNHAVSIRVNENQDVSLIRLISAQFGLAVWEAGAGLIDCRAWESEDDLEKLSYISKHYHTALMGEPREPEFALKILDDCLTAVDNRHLLRVLIEFCGEGRAVSFNIRSYHQVEAERRPVVRVRGAEQIAAAAQQRKAERESRAREQERERIMTNAPRTTLRGRILYFALPPLLLLVAMGGIFLYAYFREAPAPVAHEEHCCSPGGNSISGVSVYAVCKAKAGTEVRLYLHSDSQACARIEKTELKDYSGRVYEPRRQEGIAHCDTDGFTLYDAGHSFTWVFDRLEDDVKFLRLREIVGELKHDGKPAAFWEWKKLDLSACKFEKSVDAPSGSMDK